MKGWPSSTQVLVCANHATRVVEALAKKETKKEGVPLWHSDVWTRAMKLCSDSYAAPWYWQGIPAARDAGIEVSKMIIEDNKTTVHEGAVD